MRALILHGYSADNLGDGLLMDEAIELVRDALGRDCEVDLAASRPASFNDRDATVFSSNPRHLLRSNSLYRQLLRHPRYDLVVGVGGGYLRGKSLVETARTFVVHGPQLLFAALTRAPAVYLPQSVGPFHGAVWPVMRQLLGRVSTVYVRDDRSREELRTRNALRMSDLAVGLGPGEVESTQPSGRYVLSVRAVDGEVPRPVVELARLLNQFDGYVQSATGTNDDRAAMASVCPVEVIPRGTLGGMSPRVIAAVRLHAALIALSAGHYVVHLAYERKGWGAFADLGLDDFVHNSKAFEPAMVFGQLEQLRASPELRAEYRRRVAAGRVKAAAQRSVILERLREAVRGNNKDERL
ncbi:polysaccharide pyruvyl transferase family protein [Blastococcus sp. CT_GayMR16]|uniref:polysaccharide pyruvyl transferase family protein n=1 Tax=Blastococcus sp. CT_GayMR16 TaxID=2559607 RepID=UPI001FD7ED0E|nr:polysaccharide pyruvyl transferase family protein [Blastococcus sp. CT_GayMR16]